eukprot:gene3617-9917_t
MPGDGGDDGDVFRARNGEICAAAVCRGRGGLAAVLGRWARRGVALDLVNVATALHRAARLGGLRQH